MSIKNIEAKLVEIEARIEEAENAIELDRMLQLQVEHQILRVYLEALELSKADPSALQKKGLQLELRDEILAVLPVKERVEIVCMVKGQCGV